MQTLPLLTKDNVKVLPHSLNKEVVHGQGGDFDLLSLRPGCRLHLFHELSLLIRWEDVGHVTCVQKHVDVFHKRLVLDLVVREEEHSALGGHSGLQHDLLQVLPPIVACVILCDFDLVELVRVHECGQLGGTLPPAAPDAHQEQVAFVLLQDSTDPGDVLDGELEHDQRHGGLADAVELIQIVLHNPGKEFQVSDLIVDFLVTFWLQKIPEEEAPDVIVHYLPGG